MNDLSLTENWKGKEAIDFENKRKLKMTKETAANIFIEIGIVLLTSICIVNAHDSFVSIPIRVSTKFQFSIGTN